VIDLSGLPSMSPDAGVSDRIRQRCRASLMNGRRIMKRRGDGWLFAAAAAYLVAAIQQALAFLR
jgi:hypothetical protein